MDRVRSKTFKPALAFFAIVVYQLSFVAAVELNIHSSFSIPGSLNLPCSVGFSTQQTHTTHSGDYLEFIVIKRCG
jgi:hypothetical protein